MRPNKFEAVSINMPGVALVGIPISGSITADGTAALQTIPQESFVWSGANAKFACTMDVDKFIAAFTLSQVEVDACGELVVSMDADGKDDFKAELLRALDVDGKLMVTTDPVVDLLVFSKYLTAGANGSKVQEYLESWAQAELDADLSGNGIAAELEAEHVAALALTEFGVDASAGVAQLWVDMNAANATPNMNIIARQFSHARYMEQPTANSEGEYSVASRLPAKAGDIITFRFNIDQTYTVSQYEQAATGAAAGAIASTLGAYPGFGTGYGVAVRAVDLVLTLA